MFWYSVHIGKTGSHNELIYELDSVVSLQVYIQALSVFAALYFQPSTFLFDISYNFLCRFIFFSVLEASNYDMLAIWLVVGRALTGSTKWWLWTQRGLIYFSCKWTQKTPIQIRHCFAYLLSSAPAVWTLPYYIHEASIFARCQSMAHWLGTEQTGSRWVHFHNKRIRNYCENSSVSQLQLSNSAVPCFTQNAASKSWTTTHGT